MLKIVFKNPVGGFISQGGVAVRSVQYIWTPGFLTKEIMKLIAGAIFRNEWVFFVDAIAAMAGQTINVDGNKRQMGFFIDPHNIAWMQEFPDSVKDIEPDFKRVQ